MNTATSKGYPWIAAAATVLLGLSRPSCLLAGTDHKIDYEQPPRLTGSIQELGPEPGRVLFTFRRTAERTGATVRVLSEYRSPAGSLADREHVLYEEGRLVSYELEELQTGAKGRAFVRLDPQHGNEERIFFEYTRTPGAKVEMKSEKQHDDVLNNDMLAGFLFSHWEELMKGISVKFRFIVLQRAETVGFKLAKESETIWHGHAVVRIKMEPTSLIIARLVDPVYFTVEKAKAHRILQYTGRTTPRIKRGNKWETLDALSVYDWDDLKETPPTPAGP